VEEIEFKVYGDPVAQGRPRFFRKGNFVGTYDPEKSKSWKESVKWQAIEYMRNRQMINGAIRMELNFFLQRPKSLPKKVIKHIKRPDIDNLAKAVKDALRSICYRDDSQIVYCIITKDYAEQTGVWVRINPEEDENIK